MLVVSHFHYLGLFARASPGFLSSRAVARAEDQAALSGRHEDAPAAGLRSFLPKSQKQATLGPDVTPKRGPTRGFRHLDNAAMLKLPHDAIFSRLGRPIGSLRLIYAWRLFRRIELAATAARTLIDDFPSLLRPIIAYSPHGRTLVPARPMTTWVKLIGYRCDVAPVPRRCPMNTPRCRIPII